MTTTPPSAPARAPAPRNRGAPTRRAPRKAASSWRRKGAKLAFHVHLWSGVLSGAVLLSISVTGILLNHKRALGLMPDVEHTPTAPFSASLPLHTLADAALVAAADAPGGGTGLERIDRMDVRPDDGYVKVRLADEAATEVTVDLATGKVLHVGPRGDAFLEKLHSGEAFGGAFVVLSDIAAVALLVALVTGYWLWLVPKLGRPVGGPQEESS